jgi:hypothetical protein
MVQKSCRNIVTARDVESFNWYRVSAIMLVLDADTATDGGLMPLTIATPENQQMVRRYVAALSRDPGAA